MSVAHLEPDVAGASERAPRSPCNTRLPSVHTDSQLDAQLCVRPTGNAAEFVPSSFGSPKVPRPRPLLRIDFDFKKTTTAHCSVPIANVRAMRRAHLIDGAVSS